MDHQSLREKLDIVNGPTSAAGGNGVSSEKIEIIIDPDLENRRSKKLRYIFFIFVNAGSGDSKASLLTKLDVEKMIFSTFNPKDADVEVNIYSLRDPKSRTAGLRTLKSLQDIGTSHLRVIIGGGDGSIMWGVQEMISERISFDKCAIGTIPFGTGNDFSRVTGWGPTEPKVLIGPNLSNLKGLITKWVDAQVEDFDIWEITIETFPDGGLKQIARNGKKFEKKFMSIFDLETGNETRLTTFKKLMCNYYSFGVDSRIGYGFDKGRTKSRLGNKQVYCWEGFKKIFTKTPRLNDVVDNIQNIRIIGDGEEVPLKEVRLEDGPSTSDDFLIYPQTGIENARTDGKVHSNVTIIKGNPSVFLCLNIPSYMGGASNPWKASKGKLGAHAHDNNKLSDFEDQRFGDGKIEILSFGGPLAMASERLIAGQGRRIGQAKGPFIINFKKSENDAKPLHTYMQVDGEFYDVVAPRRVKVSLCPRIPGGKIKVLMNLSNKK